MSGWVTTDTPGGVQVIPEDDILLHVESPACPCAPKVTTAGTPATTTAGGPARPLPGR